MAQDGMMALGVAEGDGWQVWNGDCVAVAKQLPDRCVDLSVYSPPFRDLYTYSDHELDLGNADDDEVFDARYRELLREQFRITRPGRLSAVHCKDLVRYKGRDGAAGIRDFPGEIIRMHEAEGWTFAARVTIWKCPVIEMQRTKAHGLLYKTLRKDSSHTRVGLAEYVLVFRRWPQSVEEEEAQVPVTRTSESFPLDQWQQWASPIWSYGMPAEEFREAWNRHASQAWLDIDQTNVLNVQQARDDADEKHLCPLQLDVIERSITLWSNPGEVIYSPFAGIGSEGYQALKMGRRFIGSELKERYFEHQARNLREAERAAAGFGQQGLFEALG